MAMRNIQSILAHLGENIRNLDPLFPGCYRFGPKTTVGAIMGLTARCLVDSYDEALEFAKIHWGDEVKWEQAPSRSGLTRARQLLGEQPMRDLWQRQLAKARDSICPTVHKLPESRRYLAIDGSSMLVPDENAIRKLWSQAGRTCNLQPQALLVMAVEITQRIPVAATVSGLNVGERDAALTLTKDLDPQDVLLFDRGYPGRQFLGQLLAKGFDLAVRMVVGDGGFPETKTFWKSGADSAVIPVDFGIFGVHRMRFVRRRFPSGRPRGTQKRDKMVIMTTLTRRQGYRTTDILDLYQARWEVETFYRELKTEWAVETFHARTSTGILQETYAILTWMTLLAMLENIADQELAEHRGPANWNDPRRHAINRAQLARLVRSNVQGIVSADIRLNEQTSLILEQGIQRLVRQAERKRPNRSFPRRRKRPFGRFNAKNCKTKRRISRTSKTNHQR